VSGKGEGEVARLFAIGPLQEHFVGTIDKDRIHAPLADVVYQRMLNSIQTGALPPGGIINEVELAREFGVSRGPVREAVRRLQGIRIVTREPYRKARVVNVTTEEALELLQVRMGLEGVAAFLATRRMSDAEIEQLRRDVDLSFYCNAPQGPSSEGQAYHFDLHERIVRASGNKRIIAALCGDLYHLLRLYCRRQNAIPCRMDAHAEHREIVQAIARRDARLAESLIRSHIEQAAKHIALQPSRPVIRQ
jgi:DNA-binding GntR family transcriptional regulator